MRKLSILLTVVFVLGILSNPALAEFKNFGVYRDTNPNGVLDSGDTYIDGFMSWFTYYSAATSYNYSDHSDEALAQFDDLTGAPYAANQENDPGDELSWLPMDDDELHLYMAWSYYDNTSEEGLENQRSGFSLGLIANDYIRGRDDSSASGGYHLVIAVRNDDTSVPQVTMSDDYNLNGGRPPFPGGKDNLSQELWKTGTDPSPGAAYNHYFEGMWEYTASTADGGVIGGKSTSTSIRTSPSTVEPSIFMLSGKSLVVPICSSTSVLLESLES